MKTLGIVLGLFVIAALSLPFGPSASGPAAPGEEQVASFALLDLVRSVAPPLLAVLGLGLFATAAGSARGSLRRALRGLLRRADEAESAEAARTLARLARATEAAGLAVALLAAVCAFALVGEVLRDPRGAPPPARFADFLTWSTAPAAAGLALARLVFAPAADALATRAGEPTRSFSKRGDLGLFALVAPLLIVLVTFFLEFPAR